MFYKNKKYFAKSDVSTCVYFQGSVEAPNIAFDKLRHHLIDSKNTETQKLSNSVSWCLGVSVTFKNPHTLSSSNPQFQIPNNIPRYHRFHS